MKLKRIIFAVILVFATLAVLAVAACGDGTDDGGTNVQIPGVDEADIVKITPDGFVIKVQSDGVSVVKLTNGNIMLYRQGSLPGVVPLEAITNSNVLVIFASLANQKSTALFFFDMTDKGTLELVPERTAQFDGEFVTARVYDGILRFCVKTNSDKLPTDTSEAQSVFASPPEQFYEAFVLWNIDLGSFNRPFVGKQMQGNPADIYFTGEALYVITKRSVPIESGCNSDHVGVNGLTRVDLVDYNSITNKLEGFSVAFSRFNLASTEEYLLVGANNAIKAGSQLLVLDDQLDVVKALAVDSADKIAGAIKVEDELYLSLKYSMAQLDIASPTKPRIVRKLLFEDYNEHLQLFGDGKIIGIGKHNGFVKVSLYSTQSSVLKVTSSVVLQGVKHSDSIFDSHAIFSDPENSLFGVFAREQNAFGDTIFQGAFVMEVIGEEISLRGRVGNRLFCPYNMTFFDRAAFNRMVRYQGFLYAVSDGFISSYDLATLAHHATLDTRIAMPERVTVVYHHKNGEIILVSYDYMTRFVSLDPAKTYIDQHGKTIDEEFYLLVDLAVWEA